MGNCCITQTGSKEIVYGEESVGDEENIIRVMLSNDKTVKVMVRPTSTMNDVNFIIRNIPGVPESIIGGKYEPRIVMHRNNRTAPIDWEVTVEETKVKDFRYVHWADIDSVSFDGETGKPPESFVFTKEWLQHWNERPVPEGQESHEGASHRVFSKISTYDEFPRFGR